MYSLGRSLGADRIAIGIVLEIPNSRIDRELLLAPLDAALAREPLRRALRADRDAGLLQLDFGIEGWNEMLSEVRTDLAIAPANVFATAPSFREENGQCFFGWYTTAIRGNGDMYPCCLLQQPGYKPLGNAMEGSVPEQWNGPGFTKLREEMRDVLLTGGQIQYREKRFATLRAPCVEKNRCWLKNMYFRADEDFYRELGDALAKARVEEVRWTGGAEKRRRKLEVTAFRHRALVRIRRETVEFFLRWRWRIHKPLRQLKRKLLGRAARGPESP